MSESASVEVLSAEVRVLQVGDGQITRSMYRQLDEPPVERFEPFGRVRDAKHPGLTFEFLFLTRYTVIPPADEEDPPEIVVHLEMLRIACCLATERGVSVCAPVHDALLIEAPIETIDDAVSTARGAMAEAAAAVCPGVRIDTDVEIVRYPSRYSDPRGQVMWDRVMNLLLKCAPRCPEFFSTWSATPIRTRARARSRAVREWNTPQ